MDRDRVGTNCTKKRVNGGGGRAPFTYAERKKMTGTKQSDTICKGRWSVRGDCEMVNL